MTGSALVYRLQYPMHGKNAGVLSPDEVNLQAEHVCFAATPLTFCA